MNWLLELFFVLIIDGLKGMRYLTDLVRLDINLDDLDVFMLELLNGHKITLRII